MPDEIEKVSKIKENEGQGVRLKMSVYSEADQSTTSQQKEVVHNSKGKINKEKLLEKIEKMSHQTDQELKKRIYKNQGKIEYPTANDMSDKQDLIFFQMFGAYTEGYVREEEDDNFENMEMH